MLVIKDTLQRRIAMPKKEKKDESEPIHRGQKIFDNIWLLFIVSLVISTLIYNVWGIVDLMSVPLAP
jgi:hypothetical protein